MKIRTLNTGSYRGIEIKGDSYDMWIAIDPDLAPIESLKCDVDRIDAKIKRLKRQLSRLNAAIEALQDGERNG